MAFFKRFIWMVPGLVMIIAAIQGAGVHVMNATIVLSLLTGVVFLIRRTVWAAIALWRRRPLEPFGAWAWAAVPCINILGAFIVVGALSDRLNPGDDAENPPAKTLAYYKDNISDGAVFDASPSYYPKLAAKLGKARFADPYRLTAWPALFAVTSPQCDRLIAIDVSSEATRKALVWFADCENGERFIVTEANAKLTEEKLSNVKDDDPVDISGLEALPQSAAFANFDEARAAMQCDYVMKNLLQSKSSFSSAWTWEATRHPNNGRVTILRNFTARNAFNAKIDSQYECLVDARDNSILQLKFFDGTEWQTVSGE